jgi:WD40 repeat protein
MLQPGGKHVSARQRLCLFLFLMTFVPAARSEPAVGEDEKPTSKDTFGDPLPRGALIRFGTVRLRHDRTVKVVAVSTDGKLLASSTGYDGISLWDAASGQELRHIPPAPCPVSSKSIAALAFSPDGRRLASCGTVISLWDVASGQELFQFRDSEYESYHAVAFLSDGKTLATSSGGHHVSSPTRKWTQESVVCLWDAATGKMVRRFQGLTDMIEGLAVSSDGKTIASASRDRTLRLWNAATGEELRSLGKSDRPLTRVAFAPDGHTLAVGDWDGLVVVWDLDRGAEVRRFQLNHGGVESLAFAPDGRSLAAGSGARPIRLWDMATGEDLPGPDDSARTACYAIFSPDGKTLIGWGGDHSILLWDREARRSRMPAVGHRYGIESCAIAPDGKTVATASYDGLRLWDLGTGKELWRWEGNRDEWASCVAFAPDGKSLASGGAEEGVRIWDVATGREIRRIKTGECRVFEVAFAPDGQTLYSVGYFLIERWDVATGQLIRQKGRRPPPEERSDFPDEPGSSLRVSEDGQLVTAHVRCRLRLWKADTGAEVLGLPGLSDAQFAAFSPDGATLIGAGSDDGIRDVLWGWSLRSKAGWLALDPFGCRSLSWGPDGKTVVSTCKNGDVLLWDAYTGLARRRFHGHRGDVDGAVFSPDGTMVVSHGHDGTALVWDATGPAQPLPAVPANGMGVGSFWSKAPLTARDNQDPDEEDSSLILLGIPLRTRFLGWAILVSIIGMLGFLLLYRLSKRKPPRAVPPDA